MSNNILLFILLFLFGLSLATNFFLIFFLRIKFADCGNIFKIFKDDNIARKVAQKKYFESTENKTKVDKDFWGDNL